MDTIASLAATASALLLWPSFNRGRAPAESSQATTRRHPALLATCRHVAVPRRCLNGIEYRPGPTLINKRASTSKSPASMAPANEDTSSALAAANKRFTLSNRALDAMLASDSDACIVCAACGPRRSPTPRWSPRGQMIHGEVFEHLPTRLTSCHPRLRAALFNCWPTACVAMWVSTCAYTARCCTSMSKGASRCVRGVSRLDAGSQTRCLRTCAASMAARELRRPPAQRTPVAKPGTRLWKYHIRRGLRPGGTPFGGTKPAGEKRQRMRRHAWKGLAVPPTRLPKPRVLSWAELVPNPPPVRLPRRLDGFDPVVVAMSTPVRRCVLTQVMAPRACMIRFVRARETDDAGNPTSQVCLLSHWHEPYIPTPFIS